MARLLVDGLAVTVAGKSLLKRVGFALEPGNAAIIRGASGAGKSTLLRAMAGALPYAGKVCLEHDDGSSTPATCAWVPQEASLWSHWSVERNVTFVARTVGGLDKSDARELADRLLESVDLSAQRLQYPLSLSGGELRRAAFVRGLAAQAQLLLLDEVTANLDVERKQAVLRLVSQHLTGEKYALLCTHERDTLQPPFPHRNFVIRDGVLSEENT